MNTQLARVSARRSRRADRRIWQRRRCTVGFIADEPDSLDLDAIAGPWYEPCPVTEKLGVTVSEVERLVHDGDAWATRTSDRYMLLPSRQFHTGEGFGLLPGADEVMRDGAVARIWSR